MIHEKIRIWNKGDYRSRPDDGFESELDTYILDGDRDRAAVLLCPGGAYRYVSPREGEPVALQFNAAGFNAFVLHYSVAPCRHPAPLLDASRAMCLIREHAAAWRISPDKIAVCGFSAGGHVAASLAVGWDEPAALGAPGIERGMNRPDALILGYPVISSGEYAHRESIDNLLGPNASPEEIREVSLELNVNPKMPNAFIWHTWDDASVPVENSLLFAQAMRRCGVPFELHIYPKGTHGLSLATPETGDGPRGSDPHVASWMDLCVDWLGDLYRQNPDRH